MKLRTACVLLVLFFSRSSFAQNTSLAITVVDQQLAAIPNARIAVYPQGASAAIRGTTNERGVYSAAVPYAGPFLVEIDADGFRRTSKLVSADESIVLEVAGIDSSIIVTAGDAPQTADQISKAITAVDTGEIENRGEYTLTGVLSAIPGVQIHNFGGPGQLTTLRVRGLRTDSSAVLLDGMRFRDPSTLQGDASSFLSNLNIIGSDRVEVLRGSGSSLYGTNAAGGVINIITDPGSGTTHGSIEGEGGNLGFARGRVQAGGGMLGNRLKYSAGLMHLNVTRGVDGNDAARSSGGQGLFNYNPTPQTTLSGRFWGSDDFVQLNNSPTASGIPALNIPSGVVVPAIPLGTYFPGRDDPDSYRSSWFYASAVKLQQIVSSRFNFQTSYQRVHTRRVYGNGPGGDGFQPLASDYSRFLGNIDTFDARATTKLSGWNQLTAGYEFERETYDELEDNNLPAAQRVRTLTALLERANAGYFQDQSSFLQNRLQLSLSGRVQGFRLSHPAFQSTGVANNYDGVQLVSPPKALTADLSISYFVTPFGTKFRAHAGNAYRAPSLFERFGGGFFNDFSTGQLVFSAYGDPYLSPDRYNSVDGGVDQYFWRDRIRISSTYFYTRVVTITAFDLGTAIHPSTDPYGRTSGYINGSGGLSRGIEMAWELRPVSSFSLNGSYTYTRANLDRDITVPGFWRVLGVPRHAFTFVMTKQIRSRAAIAMDLNSASETYGNFTAAGRARAYRFPSFIKSDLSGSYDLWKTDTGILKLTTRIENLLNRTYYDLGWLEPGATLVAGMKFQF